MPQDLCRALAWEQQAADERACGVAGMSKRVARGPALNVARQEYLRVYWQIAGAIGERNTEQAISGATHP